MNDQLRTLVRQAVVAVDVITGNEALDDELAKMYIPDCFAEKFAELIVAECIKEVEGLQVSDWNQNWNQAIAHTALHLKEHFGITNKPEEN